MSRMCNPVILCYFDFRTKVTIVAFVAKGLKHRIKKSIITNLDILFLTIKVASMILMIATPWTFQQN